MKRMILVTEMGFAVLGVLAIVAMGGGQVGIFAAAAAALACVVYLNVRR